MAQANDKLIVPSGRLVGTAPELSCPKCGLAAGQDAEFCFKCGTRLLQSSKTLGPPIVAPTNAHLEVPSDAHPIFSRMTQMFGLHPIVTFAAIAIDWMLFGEEAATLMVGWAIAI